MESVEYRRLKEKRYQYMRENKVTEQELLDFKLKDKHLETLEIKGVYIDRHKNKLILSDDLENPTKLLLFANKENEIYYLDSAESYKEVIEDVFGKDIHFKVIEDDLYIHDSNEKTLQEAGDIKSIMTNKEYIFDKPLNVAIKENNTDLENVTQNAKESLALSLGLSSSAFSKDLEVTNIERVDDKHSLITFDNSITNKAENFIIDLKENIHEKINSNIEVGYTTRLAFEELKNASLMIAMGFLEFYGAEFDEEHMNRDPKVILEEKGYSVSNYNENGYLKNKQSVTSLEEAVQLKNQLKQEQTKEVELTDDLELVQEQELKKHE